MGSHDAPVPYWNVNVAEHQRTEACPDFLQNIPEKDQKILRTLDADYPIGTWPSVRQVVAENRLDLFQRVPSELRRYLAYMWKLRREHGSVMNFVLSERLRWAPPIVAEGGPFEDSRDLKILWNDWPYGIDQSIVHLVIWTKFDLADDPETGDLTDTARAQINAFVEKTFSPHLPNDQVLLTTVWFVPPRGPTDLPCSMSGSRTGTP